MKKIQISSAFDGGNIEVVAINGYKDIQLKIEKDTNADTFQWFYFRVSGVKDEFCKIKLINASESSYPEGWEDYQAVASYDKEEWFRVPTSYDGKTLTIQHNPEFDSVFYAYFAPYSYEQHLNMVNQLQMYPNTQLTCIGKTLEGRDIDLIQIGKNTEYKKKIWVIARQHPGETQASWFVEGLVNRLLDGIEPIAKKLREKAVFFIVPNMNIDGSIMGNLRTNVAGINLNREWENPSLERSPEVFYVFQKMHETGVNLSLDIHGDEGLPYVFISSIEGVKNYKGHIEELDEKFQKYWKRITPDFQTKHGYPKDKEGQANLKIATKQIANKFNCLAYTIEMPFKDNADMPDNNFGWSPARSQILGASVLHPILKIVDSI